MKNDYLVSFRQENNLTMDEMSEKIGISKSFYEKIESGKRQPSYNFIMKFKEVFPGADVNCILKPTRSV